MRRKREMRERFLRSERSNDIRPARCDLLERHLGPEIAEEIGTYSPKACSPVLSAPGVPLGLTLGIATMSWRSSTTLLGEAAMPLSLGGGRN